MKIFVISFATLALAGCAASPTAQPSATVAETTTTSGMVCERTYPVGSNIPTKRCFTEEEMRLKREAEAKGVDDLHESMNRNYSKKDK